MPKEIKDVKEFSQLLKSDKDGKDKGVKKIVYVKSGKKITKFKIRKSRYLYTYKSDKQQVIKKLLESFASNNIQRQDVKGRRTVVKKNVKK